jgi:hypothetical protein
MKMRRAQISQSWNRAQDPQEASAQGGIPGTTNNMSVSLCHEKWTLCMAQRRTKGSGQ